jgi:hypothetical protein
MREYLGWGDFFISGARLKTSDGFLTAGAAEVN